MSASRSVYFIVAIPFYDGLPSSFDIFEVVHFSMGPELRSTPTAGTTASGRRYSHTSTGRYDNRLIVHFSIPPVGRQINDIGLIAARRQTGFGTKSCFCVVIQYNGPLGFMQFSFGFMGVSPNDCMVEPVSSVRHRNCRYTSAYKLYHFPLGLLNASNSLAEVSAKCASVAGNSSQNSHRNHNDIHTVALPLVCKNDVCENVDDLEKSTRIMDFNSSLRDRKALQRKEKREVIYAVGLFLDSRHFLIESPYVFETNTSLPRRQGGKELGSLESVFAMTFNEIVVKALFSSRDFILDGSRLTGEIRNVGPEGPGFLEICFENHLKADNDSSDLF
uniref:Uncharacterized protein n=1 Tax=Glossina pallidipes TaxID=7398 RepID=A0A1A9Z3Q4_GLOPL